MKQPPVSARQEPRCLNDAKIRQGTRLPFDGGMRRLLSRHSLAAPQIEATLPRGVRSSSPEWSCSSCRDGRDAPAP